MRHREALRKFVEWSAAGEVAEQAVPVQSERHGDVEFRWMAIWRRDGRLWARLALVEEDPHTALMPKVQARRDEIWSQLTRWEKNEADWPLARKS